MCLRRLPSKEGGNNQQSDTDAKQAIGHIKSRPMPARPVNDVDEVADQTIIKDSIVQITADSGGKESKSYLNQSLPILAEKENREYHYQCDN